VHLSIRSTFSEFASKWGRDARFRAIEKMRERELMFSEFILEVRRQEETESRGQVERVGTLVHSRWQDTNLALEMSLLNNLPSGATLQECGEPGVKEATSLSFSVSACCLMCVHAFSVSCQIKVSIERMCRAFVIESSFSSSSSFLACTTRSG